MFVRLKDKDASFGHKKCLDNYNSTIACGVSHGNCTSPLCCFSEQYDHDLAEKAAEMRQQNPSWTEKDEQDLIRKLRPTYIVRHPEFKSMFWIYSHDELAFAQKKADEFGTAVNPR